MEYSLTAFMMIGTAGCEESLLSLARRASTNAGGASCVDLLCCVAKKLGDTLVASCCVSLHAEIYKPQLMLIPAIDSWLCMHSANMIPPIFTSILRGGGRHLNSLTLANIVAFK